MINATDDGYLCDRCGVACEGALYLPSLAPLVWSAIAPGVVNDPDVHEETCAERCQCGVLCVPCAESALGRPLAEDDYDDALGAP